MKYLRQYIRQIIREQTENTTLDPIPPDWTIYAHHITIIPPGKKPHPTNSSTKNHAKEWDEEQKTNPTTNTFTINVSQIARDDKAITVTANINEDLPDNLKPWLNPQIKTPHITIATAPGTSPVYSNQLLQSSPPTPLPSPITLQGDLKFEAGYVGIILTPDSQNTLVNLFTRG